MLQEIANEGLGPPFTRGGYRDCCAGISGKKSISSLTRAGENRCCLHQAAQTGPWQMNAVCSREGRGMRSSSVVLHCIFTGGNGFGEWVVLLKMVKKIIFHVV